MMKVQCDKCKAEIHGIKSIGTPQTVDIKAKGVGGFNIIFPRLGSHTVEFERVDLCWTCMKLVGLAQK